MLKKKEKKERNAYNVSLTFDVPTQGSIVVAAFSEEEAKELVSKMFANQKNVNIIDIFDLKDCKSLENFYNERFSDDENDPKLVN